MPDKPRPLYIPLAGEPSVFSAQTDGIPLEWTSWFKHTQIYDVDSKKPFMLTPPSRAMISEAAMLRERLRAELKRTDFVLPDEPPSLYVPGTYYTSLVWVLDTCRREKMEPEEAVVLGAALKRM